MTEVLTVGRLKELLADVKDDEALVVVRGEALSGWVKLNPGIEGIEPAFLEVE